MDFSKLDRNERLDISKLEDEVLDLIRNQGFPNEIDNSDLQGIVSAIIIKAIKLGKQIGGERI